MKKLVLNKTTFSGGEVLSRAQLKKVLGGTESTTSKKVVCSSCNTSNDCKFIECPDCIDVNGGGWCGKL